MRLCLIIVIITFFAADSVFSNSITMQHVDSLINYGASISSSRHREAIKILDSARILSQNIGYRRGEAEAIRKKGIALFYAINYKEALELFLKSKTIFEDISDSIGIGDANNMIAIVYSYHGLDAKALEIDLGNLALREKINDTAGISGSLNNIGVGLKNLNRFEEALSYYKRAIEFEICKVQIDSIALSRYYDNLGSLYLRLQYIDSAKNFIDKSLDIRLIINDRQGIKNSYEALGEYYYHLKDYKKAKINQERALTIAYEIGIVYEIESITFRLSQTLAKLGEYKKAYDVAVINLQMLDSMRSQEKNDLLTKLEVQKALASEKKIQQLLIEKNEAEKQIEIDKAKNIKITFIIAITLLIIIFTITWINLKNNKKHNKILLQKNNEITSQNEEILAQHEEIAYQNQILEQLNTEKDKFFSIIAHDLKSPFSGFLGLTKTLAENHDSFSSEELREYAISMQESAMNLYKLLENLLEWSRMQRGMIEFNQETIDLKFLIQQNINIQKEVSKQKEIELIDKVSENTFVHIDIPMINTVFRNLLSNAIKFTQNSGKIEIGTKYLETYPNYITVYIKDSGIGMDDEILTNLFKIDYNVSRVGTNNEPSTGLGLLLCKEFIEKQGGKIWAESQLGQGSIFYFTLPKVLNLSIL